MDTGSRLLQAWKLRISVLRFLTQRQLVPGAVWQTILSPIKRMASKCSRRTGTWSNTATKHWKGGSMIWIPLKDAESADPVHLAEYSIAAGVSDEPAFAWWAPFTIRKRNQIIQKLNPSTGSVRTSSRTRFKNYSRPKCSTWRTVTPCGGGTPWKLVADSAAWNLSNHNPLE